MKKPHLIAAGTVSMIALGALGMSAFADNRNEGKRHAPYMDKWVEMTDMNGDGNVSKDEIAAHKAARFAETDGNGDGQISFDEFEAFAEAERERRAMQRRKMMFDRVDADSDGFISAQEMADAPQRGRGRGQGGDRFDRMDTDGDGVLTPEEMDAAREAMMAMRGERRRGIRGGSWEAEE